MKPQSTVPRQGPDDAGFSLLEVIVALALFALVATATANAIGGGLTSIRKSNARQASSQAAARQIEIIRQKVADVASLALRPEDVSEPQSLFESTDPDSPDFGRVIDSNTKFVTEHGIEEDLVFAQDDGTAGEELHRDSVTQNATTFQVYRYISWGDDPGIAGTHNYKRFSVIVQWLENGKSKQTEMSSVITNGELDFTTTTLPDCTGDSVGPTGASVSINGGAASTTSSDVTLTLAATDTCLPISMAISNASDCSGAVVYAFATSRTWTLASGNGTKTVCVRYEDGEGNFTQASDTINVTAPATDCTGDSTFEPTSTMVIEANAATTTTLSVTLNLTETDTCDPVQMKIGNSGACSSATYEAFTSTKSWTLASGGEGTRSVCVVLKDNNNNTLTITDDITYTVAPTAPASITVTRPNGNPERKTVAYISWTAATDASGIGGYYVERQIGGSGGYSVIHTCSGSSCLSYTNSGLDKNTGYQYRVRAYDTLGTVGPYTSVFDV